MSPFSSTISLNASIDIPALANYYYILAFVTYASFPFSDVFNFFNDSIRSDLFSSDIVISGYSSYF